MAETPEERLEELGLRLPAISKAAGNLLGFKIDHGQVFVSGQLPIENGRLRYVGKIGVSISRDDGVEAARLAALNAIGQLFLAVGGRLSRIAGIVKVSDFVNCPPDFVDILLIVDGAWDLFAAVFGYAGRHARFAVGVASLPRGVPVEIDMVGRLAEEE